MQLLFSYVTCIESISSKERYNRLMKRNIQRSEDTNNEFINLLSNAATSSVSDEDGTPIIHSTATANTSATAPTGKLLSQFSNI